MYGYGYKYTSGLVINSGGGGAPFANTKSLQFDGIDDYVDCGNDASLDITGSITISVWAKTSSTDDKKLIMKDDASANRSYQIQINRNTNGVWVLFWLGGGNLKIAYSNINDHIVDGNWHHVAAMFKSGQHIKLYVDGVEYFTQNVTETTLDSANTPFIIGANGVGGTATINGNIDEVSVFDRALDFAEITDIYNGGTPTDLSAISNLVSWYRNGDNGSWKSPQWLIPNNENFAANKVSNYSMDFDGVGDSLNIGNVTAISNTTEFSVSCWFNTDNINTQTTLWSQGSSASQLWAATKQNQNFIVYGGTSTKYKLSAASLAINTWYNLVVVYNGALVNADKYQLYLNGVLLGGTPTGTIETTTPTFTTDAIIGRISYVNASYFNGNIDETAFFNTALNQSDVDDIYNGGTPTTIIGATNHYKMGEEATFAGGVWTVPDNVGINDGTSSGMLIDSRVGEAPNSTSNAVSLNMDFVDVVPDTP
jgi:hypothetical protein